MTKIANNIVASALICGVLTIAGTAIAVTVKITVAADPQHLDTLVGVVAYIPLTLPTTADASAAVVAGTRNKINNTKITTRWSISHNNCKQTYNTTARYYNKPS